MLSALVFYVIINGVEVDRFRQTYKSAEDCNVAMESIKTASDYGKIQVETACEESTTGQNVNYHSITPMTGFRLAVYPYANEGKPLPAPRLKPVIYKDVLSCTSQMMMALEKYKLYGELLGVCLPASYYTETDVFQ
jgi:hypothetical protein